MTLALVTLLLVSAVWVSIKWAGRARPPDAGDAAPTFALYDAYGQVHRLEDYRGRWVVIYFYPKAGTPGCIRQACTLRDHWPAFQHLDVVVLGVSMDARPGQQAFASRHGLPFPLLCDVSGQVSLAYGSCWDFALIRFPMRHTFIVRPDGQIARVFFQVHPARHAEEVLGALREFGLAA